MELGRLAKDRSRARIDGGVFEFKVAGLAAARLRALRRRRPDLRFLLATNVDGANPFDDVVLRLRWTDGGEERAITYFVQLKHKENVEKPVSEKELTGKTSQRNKDFNLRYYFSKYREAVKNAHKRIEKTKGNQRQLREWLRDDFRLVLLTTREVLPDKQARTSTKVPFPFEEIFQTDQGEAFSFDESDAAVWSMFHGSSDEEPFKDFLARLRVVSGQAQVQALEPLLARAVAEALGGLSSHADRLLAQYSTFLHRWWDSDYGGCLSEGSSEIEQIIAEDVNSQIGAFLFQPRYYSGLAQRMRDWDATYVVVPGTSARLRCAMLKRMLERNHQGRFVLLSDSAFAEYPSTALESVCSKICEEVVISTDDSETLCDFLKKVMPLKKCRVRVLSSEWAASVFRLLMSLTAHCNTWSEHWTLEKAAAEEQQKIMARKVSFQGHEVALSSLEAVWPSLRKGVTGSTMCALALGEPVTIGAPLPAVDSIYLPRTVEHRVALHPSVFEMRSAKDHFLLSGFPDETLRQLRAAESSWQECLPCGAPAAACEEPPAGWRSACSPNKALAMLAGVGKRSSRTMWREWDPLKDSVRRDEKARANVHWLTYERNQVIWNHTDGDSRSLQKYINKMTPNCKDQPVCTHNGTKDFLEWRDGTVLLTDTAGMGKTMFITQMAHTIKEARKAHWVLLVRMSEGRVMNELPKQIELHHVLELLKRSALSKNHTHPDAGGRFLEETLMTTGSIEVLVDGVDEVCPVHKEKALRILEILQRTLEARGGRLWAVARTALEEALARTLRCGAPLSLRAFTPRDQQRYLVRHWRSGLGAVGERELEARVGTLVNAVRRATGSGERSLCDVPLYTCMLAKAYEGDELYPLITDAKVDLAACINRLALYKRFVQKTLGVIWDKAGIPEGDRENLGISIDDVALKKHMLYAALDCFNDKKLMGSYYDKARNEVNKLEDEFEREKAVKKGIIADYVDGKPSFIHRTISEYLAAQWLQERYRSLPELTRALYEGDFGEVRYFFDALMAEGLALHEAALSGRLIGVKTALAQAPGVDAEDCGGRRALHLAAVCGHEQIARALLAAGADAALRDAVLGWTALRYADCTLRFPSGKWDWLSLKKDALPQLAVADHLLRCGAKSRDAPNILKQENFLDHAFRRDYAEIAMIFIKKSGPVFVQKLRGENFLHRAAFQGSRQVVAMLVRAGFSVNAGESSRGDTPLHVAAQEGLEDVCELLLQSGARVGKADRQGAAPLHRAAQEGHEAVCALLLLRGAEHAAADGAGRTALHEAAARGHEGAAHALLAGGARADARDARQATALHEAARGGHAPLCRLLLDEGADAGARNLRGESAYDVARRLEHEDACRLLRAVRPAKPASVRN